MSDTNQNHEQQNSPSSIELDDHIVENPQQEQYNFLPNHEDPDDDVSEPKKSHTKTIILIACALVILGGLFAYFNTQPSAPVTETTAPPAAKQDVPVEEKATTDTPPVEQAPEVPSITEEKVLIEESVLNQPIAEDTTLQEEEISKLNEIEKQLIEQKNNLEAQSQDVDELIRLKEEQIKLLEAELSKKQ